MVGLIRFFAERHLMVHVMVGVVAAVGFATATRTPREGMPNVLIPMLLVEATLRGADARDVETKVTIPIEEAIESVDGVKSFSTVITDSRSTTTVELYDDYTAEQIRNAEQDLRQVINAIADFPAEMEETPSVLRVNPGKLPVIEIALSGPLHDVTAAAKRLKRRLRTLDTVAQVTLVGLQDPEVRVLVDPLKATEHQVALTDIIGAIQRRNVSSTGGTLESATDRRQVVLWSRFEDPRDVAETVIRSSQATGTLTVGDVARVQATREDTGLLVHTNAQPGISIVVYKRANADQIDMVDDVSAVLDDFDMPASVVMWVLPVKTLRPALGVWTISG